MLNKTKELCVKTLTKKHQCFALKCWQPHDLFVRHKIKLIKQRVVLGQVFIVVDLLFSTKPHTVNYITNTTDLIINGDELTTTTTTYYYIFSYFNYYNYYYYYCNYFTALCSIVKRVNVGLHTSTSHKPHVQTSPNILCVMPVTVARSSSGGVLFI